MALSDGVAALQPLLAIQPEPQLLVARDGRVLAANDAAARLFGAAADRLVGTSLADWLADPPESLAPLLRQGLRSAAASPARLVLRDAAGGRIDLRAQIGALPGVAPDGAALAWLRLVPHAEAVGRFVELNQRIDALSHEVAKWRRAEAALAEQREWLAVVLRSIGDGVVATDLEGRVVFLNPMAERITGWREAEAIGRPVEAVITVAEPVGRRLLVNPVREVLRTGRPGSIVAGSLLVTRSGGEWPVDDSAAPIVDAQGRVAGAVLVFREISARMQADRERADLENRLREAQKMEAIGTLAGGIAHDFNNVVASVLANAGMAIDALPEGHPLQPPLHNIRVAGARARDLVRKILAFSRRQPRAPRRLQLQPVLEEGVGLLRGTVPARVQIQLELDPTPCPVEADPTQLLQVLLNLCTNAWQAMRGSTGEIEVRLARRDVECIDGLVPGFEHWQPGPHAVLSVRDNGCGMDESTQRRVFEPFFTTKPEGEGTGLGLPMVHGIVAEHGGAMALESRPGAGTLFTVYLPIAEPDTTPGEAEGGALAPSTLQGLRVVYVDDDEVMRLTIEALLHRAGFAVATFAGGEAARAALRDADLPCDVLVTDYNMPRLSGLDLAREMRRLRPALPIVISTGFLSDELVTGAMELGVRLMQKEESYERIATAIQEALQR